MYTPNLELHKMMSSLAILVDEDLKLQCIVNLLFIMQNLHENSLLIFLLLFYNDPIYF